jgi:hypothetical protein
MDDRPDLQLVAQIRVLDPGPIPYAQLPMAGDEDLEAQLDANFGSALSTYAFRLVELPLALLDQPWFIPEEGLDHFRRLAREDAVLQRWLEQRGGECADECDQEEYDRYFADGERRGQIVRDYLARLRAGEELEPLVYSWFDNHSYTVPQLHDGYHRLLAAKLAGAQTVQAYELLDD